MRYRSSLLALTLLGLSAGGVALAQPAPPPAPAPGPIADAGAPPPPPPGGPRGERPPPPPPGAAVMLDRGPNGTVHVDVHCARTDTTKDCADIASRLLVEAGAK